MTHLTENETAPNFTGPISEDKTISLADFKGKTLILFFYPKDNTPGCTQESCDFRDMKSEFEALGAEVVGISKDSLKKHENFSGKYGFNFPLLSDENGTMCEDYGVWKEKSMYGKTYMGIERTTFIIDGSGKIAKIWPKVKVKGHVDEVLSAVKSL